MRNLAIGLAAVLAVGAVDAGASNGWGLGLAYWDTADAGDSAGPMLKIGIEASEAVRLDLRLSYFNELGGEADGFAADLEMVPLEGGLSLELPLAEGLDAYLGGGVGYYFADAPDTDDEVGYYVGGSLEWLVRDAPAAWGGTQAVLFGEVLYRFLDLDGTELDGPGVGAGLMIRW